MSIKLVLTVNEGDVGSILADLGDRVKGLEYHVVQQVSSKGMSATDLMMKLLKQRMMTVPELKTAFVEAGFKKSTYLYAVKILGKQKVIRKSGNQYALTRKGGKEL